MKILKPLLYSLTCLIFTLSSTAAQADSNNQTKMSQLQQQINQISNITNQKLNQQQKTTQQALDRFQKEVQMQLSHLQQEIDRVQMEVQKDINQINDSIKNFSQQNTQKK